MDVLDMIAMLEALKWKLSKYGKFENFKAQLVDSVFIFDLEYRNAVL